MTIWFVLFVILNVVLVGNASQPNIIVFLGDDLGYGDIQTYGNPDQKYNAIDKMAKEGMKFTDWVAGGPKCTPSRAALLTGRYPIRSGIYGDSSQVFAPRSRGGLPSSELTLAEVLKNKGYRTGMVGKWHLGINHESSTDGVHLPHNHGFDWVGTNLPHGQSGECDPSTTTPENMKNSCFVYNGSNIVEQPIDVKDLSKKLRDDAIYFVRQNKERPFFLYLAFPHVHPAVFCNSQFCGSSKSRGTYGDNINEMAWIVGAVLDELINLEIDKNSLAIFTSDQGAPPSSCRSVRNNINNNGPFRGGKSTTWEGGYRVPAIAWWPGTINAGSNSDTLISHMDILPTAAYLAGGNCYLRQLKRRVGDLDGQLIPELVKISNAPRESVFYYCSDKLFAVRYMNYKLHYYTMGSAAVTKGCAPARGDFSCKGADIVQHDPPLVFDLDKNEGESETTPESNEAVKSVIDAVKDLVEQHQTTLSSIPPSQIDLGGAAKLIPCCGDSCTCNYEGVN